MPATTVHYHDAPADWRPLDNVVRLVADTPHAFEPGWFMYMGRAINNHGVTIHLYKHNLTRGHLNLDDACHAYRYRDRQLPNGGWSAAWYVPYKNLTTALDHARLREVDRIRCALDALD